MNERYEFRPGEWPDLSVPQRYHRLVALAKRRLIGHEQHAEDAVSRAIIRWAQLSPDLRSVARLEQVVASEAISLLRSEARRRAREERATRDRTLQGRSTSERDDLDSVLLLLAIGKSLTEAGHEVADPEVEILDLLRAGLTTAEVCRRCGCSRYYVDQVRRRWRVLLRPIFRLTDAT